MAPIAEEPTAGRIREKITCPAPPLRPTDEAADPGRASATPGGAAGCAMRELAGGGVAGGAAGGAAHAQAGSEGSSPR